MRSSPAGRSIPTSPPSQRHAPPARRLPLIALDPDPFVELEEPVDLGRFSRYWRRAERRVWAQWGQEPN
jgi:hypothetical protein